MVIENFIKIINWSKILQELKQKFSTFIGIKTTQSEKTKLRILSSKGGKRVSKTLLSHRYALFLSSVKIVFFFFFSETMTSSSTSSRKVSFIPIYLFHLFLLLFFVCWNFQFLFFRISVRLPPIGFRKSSLNGRLILLLVSTTKSAIISKGI